MAPDDSKHPGGLIRAPGEGALKEARVADVLELSTLSRQTFYKLFPTREACLLEAFERCAEAIFRRVAAAVASETTATERAEAGMRALVELLAQEPDVARLVLVEIRVGELPCREAQQRWLARIEVLVDSALPLQAETARLTIGGLSTILALEVAAGRASELPGMLAELVNAASLGCRDSGLGGEVARQAAEWR